MRVLCLFALLLSGSLFVVMPGCSRGSSTASTAAPRIPAKFFTVAHYDPERDASADLSATIQQATADRKRIILEVGGDW